MAGKSNIEWTEHTWNPIVGCSIVSPGCTNCYAMKMAARIEAMNYSVNGSTGGVKHYLGTTKTVNGNAVWTGKLALAPDSILLAPLKRRKPTTYFVNSMGDLFHEDAPDEWIVKVLDVIRRTSWDGGSNCGKIRGEHTYQVLTKRAARMAAFMPRLRFDPRDDRALFLSDDGKHPVILKNLWLGVSCERQQEADERIPLLLQTPAAIRFVSAEPLLGPIDFDSIAASRNPDGSGQYATPLYGGVTHRSANGYADDPSCCQGSTPIRLREIQETPKLDWVIVGGESGSNARPMHPDWARSLRDQCAAASVPYFFKQWGQFVPFQGDMEWLAARGGVNYYNPTMKSVGKKAAGRLLDGKEHNAMPLSDHQNAPTDDATGQRSGLSP